MTDPEQTQAEGMKADEPIEIIWPNSEGHRLVADLIEYMERGIARMCGRERS